MAIFRKGPFIFGATLFAAICLSLGGSYMFSKGVAENYVKRSGAPVKLSRGHLVLFVGGEMVYPRWRFVFEFGEEVLTGSTYDVQVSLLGTIVEPKNGS